MYIVTTRKRIIQITLIVVLITIGLLGYIGLNYYLHSVALPQQLIERLLQAAAGDAELAVDDYDRQALLTDARNMIATELHDDLAKTDLPDDKDAVSYLLGDASLFLDDEQMFRKWLTKWLQDIYRAAGDDVIAEVVSDDQRRLHMGEQCLILEPNKHRWRLISITGCPAGAS
ncbi:MAG: hypothetical protein P8X89_05520 [Reinekea sp.]